MKMVVNPNCSKLVGSDFLTRMNDVVAKTKWVHGKLLVIGNYCFPSSFFSELSEDDEEEDDPDSRSLAIFL